MALFPAVVLGVVLAVVLEAVVVLEVVLEAVVVLEVMCLSLSIMIIRLCNILRFLTAV